MLSGGGCSDVHTGYVFPRQRDLWLCRLRRGAAGQELVFGGGGVGGQVASGELHGGVAVGLVGGEGGEGRGEPVGGRGAVGAGVEGGIEVMGGWGEGDGDGDGDGIGWGGEGEGEGEGGGEGADGEDGEEGLNGEREHGW